MSPDGATPGLGSAGHALKSIENVITGSGNDLVFGSYEANRIETGAGNDQIIGRGGADILIGGGGDDFYQIQDQTDLVFENSDEGIDTIESGGSLYLYQNVENLVLLFGDGIYGIGNNLANSIRGNNLANLLRGGAGDDTLFGHGENDRLFGQDGADTLYGESGIDYLLAGTGNDILDGGTEADALYGQDGDDLLDGGNSFDTDILVGGTGNDVLDGDSGESDYDLLSGGSGDDAYHVDTGTDLIFETSGGGTDTVYANVPVAGAGVYLYANVENLILEGTTFFGVGNELDNQLTGSASGNWLLGGAGNDRITGADGNDVLFGQAGADTFVFGAGSGGDTIGDFALAEDKIELSSYFASFAQVQGASIQNGANMAINLGGGNFIVLRGVDKANLTAANFTFAPAAEAPPPAKAMFAAEQLVLDPAARFEGADGALWAHQLQDSLALY